MNEQYQVELIALDRQDPARDISLKKTVRASNEEAALRKAKTLAKDENPDFNHLQVWAWCIQRRLERQV